MSSSPQATENPLSKHFRDDIISGFQVFLIALPLSLGISIASGFPPIAGIVAAIVGGLIVSRISGSHVTINGPAAGLIVVILSGVEKLGHGDPVLGYKLTLAAIVCAGVMQILFGVFKVGKLSTYFPVAAVHGMLAAIGVIIIVKQIPALLGTTAKAKSIFGMIGTIPQTVMDANPLIAGIGVLGLIILIGLQLIKNPKWKKIPAPIIVVTFAAFAASALGVAEKSGYQMFGRDFSLGANYLVTIPDNIFGSLAFPDFSQVLTMDFLSVTLSIGIIASLESILSAAAIDKLDPYKRKTDLNKDILAVGVGTTISGLLGGLPMIAEIVRSSANINSGAKTGWANFFHGLMLLVAVLVIPGLIGHIPLAALAALLIYTGYRLASPKEIVKIRSIGFDQLFIFTVTLVTVLATDLLIGIGAGIVAKVILHLVRQVPFKRMLRGQFVLQEKGNGNYTIEIKSALVFTNLIGLLTIIERLPADAQLTIDLKQSHFIDHTAIEKLHDLKREFSLQGGELTIHEHSNHEPYSTHDLAARRLKA